MSSLLLPLLILFPETYSLLLTKAALIFSTISLISLQKTLADLSSRVDWWIVLDSHRQSSFVEKSCCCTSQSVGCVLQTSIQCQSMIHIATLITAFPESAHALRWNCFARVMRLLALNLTFRLTQQNKHQVILSISICGIWRRLFRRVVLQQIQNCLIASHGGNIASNWTMSEHTPQHHIWMNIAQLALIIRCTKGAISHSTHRKKRGK